MGFTVDENRIEYLKLK